MDTFGEKIKKLRVDLALPLRTVSAFLDIDQAILSKIERGQRIANRQQVIKLALYFQADKNELLIDWLSDKLLNEMKDEELVLQAFSLAIDKFKNTHNNQQ
jgi:HTH-type transcriptional regulator, competence development regulator